MSARPVPEFVFELRVCQWAERNWPPVGQLADDTVALVARQLGTQYRRWDTIVVEADPDQLYARACFGERRLDSDLLHVVRNAPRTWTWYQEALPDPGYPWRYVREAVHTAGDRDLIETRKRDNRIELRRKWRFPEWVDRIVAIENKPDLDASAARDLAPQIERDVALGLADDVWVATADTGETIEPALLEDMPVEAGILTYDRDRNEASVRWNPRTLAVEDPGTRILDRPDGSDRDASAARFEYADPSWKADKRLEIAERAFERGFRSYVETMRPDCRHFQLRADEGTVLPWCGAKACHQTASVCRGACAEWEPEPPAWRQRGWPLDGGPGKAIQRLLARRRRRRRPGLSE